jgi:hypothetical protein
MGKFIRSNSNRKIENEVKNDFVPQGVALKKATMKG